MATSQNDQKPNQQEHAKYKQLAPIPPKEKGWLFEHLCQFQGFWFDPKTVDGLMWVQDHFQAQPTDIIVATYMKCGTTWLKALVFAIANRSCFDFSTHPLLTTNPQDVFPILDLLFLTDDNSAHQKQQQPPPRLFSTHIPYPLWPEAVSRSGCRVVYLCRDPKDVFVSTWHFVEKLRSKALPPLSMEASFDAFCNGVSPYGPFWDSVLGYWQASLDSPEKVLFLRYEDLHRETANYVKKIGAFMGLPFSPEEEEEGVVEEIVRLCSFSNLSNLEVNRNGGGGVSELVQKSNLDESEKPPISNRDFFRKGQVGDWKNHLTAEMAERIDEITREKLQASGLNLV